MVGERWSVKVAVLFGALLGPPLRLVYDALGDVELPESGHEFAIYLGVNMMLGAVVLALVAFLRNQILVRPERRVGHTQRE